MASQKTHFFVLGATGYLGAGALQRFLDHPNASNWTFTALARSGEKAKKLETIESVTSVVGTLDDSHILEKEATKADVVLSFANSDHLESIKALLCGCRKRFESSGAKPSFLHISGTGVLHDDAFGAKPSDVIYSDLDSAAINSLPPTQIHRPVDLELVEADEQGYVNTYIILPGNVVGDVKGNVVDLGVANGVNLTFIGGITQVSLARGAFGTLGEGKNIWPAVDIEDLSDLIILIYNAVTADPTQGHGKNGYFFAENGESTMFEFQLPILEELYAAGKLKTNVPTPFNDQELAAFAHYVPVISGNARCRADRGRRLGWAPNKDITALLESQREHARAFIQQLPA